MTIAIGVKVGDGQVLAADSAATIPSEQPGQVWNIYDHANKIVNLRKGLPLGIMFWDAGGIGGVSMELLAKDLRVRFSGDDPERLSWRIDPMNYRLVDVAEHAYEFFINEKYLPAYGEWEPGDRPTLGFVIAG